VSKRRKVAGSGTGDKAFRLAFLTILVLLIFFLVGIIIAMVAQTSISKLLATLLSQEVLFAIRLSLFTATTATLMAMIVAVPVAYAISQTDFPGKSVVDAVLDLPIVVSPIALGAALLLFFGTPIGSAIENRFLRFVFEVPGIILAQFTVIHALAVRLLKATFDSIDPRLEQVARTLGYSKRRAFFRVTLPLARNGIIAAAILTWARALGEFGATVTLAGATHMKTETLPVAIFLSLATADVEKAIAIVCILVALAFTALIVLRIFTRTREIS
jgi:molybdate transport system permease protein